MMFFYFLIIIFKFKIYIKKYFLIKINKFFKKHELLRVFTFLYLFHANHKYP
jgi:hypothetical protein